MQCTSPSRELADERVTEDTTTTEEDVGISIVRFHVWTSR